MEARDPELKAAGDRLRDLEAHLAGEPSRYGIRERSLRRLRKARMKWRKPMTPDQERNLAGAAKAVADAIERRDKLIRDTAALGTSNYAIAKATGLSAPGVGKIVKRAHG